MKKEKKKELVEDLHERMERATFAAVTDFRGLDVIAISELRKNLREVDMEYQVVKNTLLIRASEGTDVSQLQDQFTGPSAVALCYGDPVDPARVLTKFATDQKKFSIRKGVLQGKIVGPEEIKAVSNLPSREVLLAQTLSAINGVSTGMVTALSGVHRNLMQVIKAVAEKQEAA